MYGSENSLAHFYLCSWLSAAAHNYVLKSQDCNVLQSPYDKFNLGESWFSSICLFSLEKHLPDILAAHKKYPFFTKYEFTCNLKRLRKHSTPVPFHCGSTCFYITADTEISKRGIWSTCQGSCKAEMPYTFPGKSNDFLEETRKSQGGSAHPYIILYSVNLF